MKFKRGNVVQVGRVQDKYAIIIINGTSERTGIDEIGKESPTGEWQYEATLLKSSTGIFLSKKTGQQMNLSQDFLETKGTLLSDTDSEAWRLLYL